MVPLAYLRPNSLNALTLGAICVRQSAYRTNDEPLPLHPSEKEIRILIADDHPIVCEGLIAVFALEDDLKVVGHAHDGDRQLVGSVTFRFTEDQEFPRKSSKIAQALASQASLAISTYTTSESGRDNLPF